MFSYKMNKRNNCTRDTFAVSPTQSRLGNRPPAVSEQGFDRETSDTALWKGLQAISILICAANGLACLRRSFLSEPLPPPDFLLCYHSPHFIFHSLLSVFDALGIKAPHTCYGPFCDIQAPAVSEASSAEDVTTE